MLSLFLKLASDKNQIKTLFDLLLNILLLAAKIIPNLPISM